MEKDYLIEIRIKPYEGELRRCGNTFTFEQAEIIAILLDKKRDKLCEAIQTLPPHLIKEGS